MPGGRPRSPSGSPLSALAEVGVLAESVVATRMSIVDAADADAVGLAHARVFADVRPAATMVVVAGLIDPAMLVEVEVTAWVGEPGRTSGVSAAVSVSVESSECSFGRPGEVAVGSDQHAGRAFVDVDQLDAFAPWLGDGGEHAVGAAVDEQCPAASHRCRDAALDLFGRRHVRSPVRRGALHDLGHPAERLRRAQQFGEQVLDGGGVLARCGQGRLRPGLGQRLRAGRVAFGLVGVEQLGCCRAARPLRRVSSPGSRRRGVRRSSADPPAEKMCAASPARNSRPDR